MKSQNNSNTISYVACAEGFAKFILKITNQSKMDKDSGVEYANYLGQLSPKFDSINSEQIIQLFGKIFEFQEKMNQFVVEKRNEISRNLGNSSSLDLGCVEKLKVTQDLLKMNVKRNRERNGPSCGPAHDGNE